MDDVSVVRDIRALVGGLSEDEVALVRMLTPARPGRDGRTEHLMDLVDLLDDDPRGRGHGRVRLRHRPGLGRHHRDAAARGQVTTVFTRYELESCGVAPTAAVTA